jgi:hypothetical protein
LLEQHRPQDALDALKGEGLCKYGRCASLTAAHRLLERWAFCDVSPDKTLTADTEAFIHGKELPESCPACDQSLCIACPSCGRKHLD